MGGGQALTSLLIATPATSSFSVPPGVETFYDAFLWGSGGTGADAADPDAGGGGGGGSFSRTGPLAATPGSTWNYRVSTQGTGFTTYLQNSLAAFVGTAGSGQNGAGTVGGAGGIVGTGLETWAGGAGADGLDPNAGGGGGSAGYGSAGGNALGPIAGTAGGTTTLLGFGAGAAGGNGSVSGTGGQPGGQPGGGGGGGSVLGPDGFDGGDGKIVLFYFTPVSLSGQLGCISLSHRQDVQPGQGILNFMPNTPWPTVITDETIGDAITLPWWIVSGIEGVVIQITEYLYLEEDDNYGENY